MSHSMTIGALSSFVPTYDDPFINGPENGTLAEAATALENIVALEDFRAQITGRVLIKDLEAKADRAHLAHQSAAIKLASAHADGSINDPSIGNWLTDLANSAAAAARKAAADLQAAINRTNAAIADAARQAREAAARLGHQIQAGATGANQAISSALKKSWNAALSAVNKLSPSPMHRIELYMLLPPPANFVAAYKYATAHREELMRDLPGGIRDAALRLERDISGIFGGTISGPPSIAGWWGDHIAGPWSRLSSGKKTTIIAIIVIVIILILVISFFSAGAGTAPATTGGTQVVGAGTAAAAPTFFSSIGGWSTVAGILPLLLNKIRGGPGVPVFPPVKQEHVPTQEELAALAAAMKNTPYDPEHPLEPDPKNAALASAAATVGFGLLGVL